MVGAPRPFISSPVETPRRGPRHCPLFGLRIQRLFIIELPPSSLTTKKNTALPQHRVNWVSIHENITMASNNGARCCTIGVAHEGTPKGKTTKVSGLDVDVYVAEPTGDKVHKDVAILYIPDVIGIWQNSQLMADQYAANGYYCFIPDVFNGDAIPLNRPEGFDLMSWLTKGSNGDNPHTPPAVDPIVEASLKYLRSEKGFKKVGAVGYCFGAKYVARYMPSGKGIDVGYVAHPSFVEEEELKAIKGPFSISAAETDPIFPVEKRQKSEEILRTLGLPYQINLFSGVEHGFSVRCDLSNKIQKFSKEQAFLQAVAWFDEYLV